MTLVQRSIFDYRAQAVPVTGWTIIDGGKGRAEIYRSNAESFVEDLGRIPSGKGIWPRLIYAKMYGDEHLGDMMYYQCRGKGSVTKYINLDGSVRDCVTVGRESMDVYEAWIDACQLHLITSDGMERTVAIVEDDMCNTWDRQAFDPARYPEHFLLLAIQKGIRGKILKNLWTLPHSFDLCNPLSPEIEAVWSMIPQVGVVPRMSYNVHHITEFMPDLKPVDYTCKRCTKSRPGGKCQNGFDRNDTLGECMFHFIWNGAPYPKRGKAKAEPDDDEDDCCEEAWA